MWGEEKTGGSSHPSTLLRRAVTLLKLNFVHSYVLMMINAPKMFGQTVLLQRAGHR
jgi:hypothetical protein